MKCKMEFLKLFLQKTKVTPVKSELLPTLELLAVFITFKAMKTNNNSSVGNNLHFVVKGYVDAVITDIYIFVDAQLLLSWLLKDNIRIKNIFTGNRVKDINDIKNQIEKNSDIRIKYKYVHTTENPVDLIFRGITIAKFENMYAFWSHGPYSVIKERKRMAYEQT